MFCTQCGTQNDDNYAFCIHCGAPLNATPAPATPQTPMQSAAPTPQTPMTPAVSAPQNPMPPAPENAAATEDLTTWQRENVFAIQPDAPSPVQEAAAVSAAAPTEIFEESVEEEPAFEPTTIIGDAIADAQLSLMRMDNRETYPITVFPSVLGRVSTSPVSLSDCTTISREHARIIREGNQFFIIDNGSTNGTQVNGSLVGKHSRTPLNNGDNLVLADVYFVVIVNEN